MVLGSVYYAWYFEFDLYLLMVDLSYSFFSPFVYNKTVAALVIFDKFQFDMFQIQCIMIFKLEVLVQCILAHLILTEVGLTAFLRWYWISNYHNIVGSIAINRICPFLLKATLSGQYIGRSAFSICFVYIVTLWGHTYK